MLKKLIIFIIVIASFGIIIVPFFNKKWNSHSIINYEWKILSNKNIIIQHNFSWQHKEIEEYNIKHNIHIMQKTNTIIDITLDQSKTEWSHNIILQDYRILTGQWNHRLTLIEQEFLKKNKNKSLPWIKNLSGLEYQINYKRWFFIDIFTIKWVYINQLNQNNYYNIVLKINCGINQYYSSKQKCTIDWEIWLDLPINTYTKTWYVQWILYKQPMI